jgi:hypothetical protein
VTSRTVCTVEKGGTIKLTFNKDVDVTPGDNFKIDTTVAYHKVDGDKIYVWVTRYSVPLLH